LAARRRLERGRLTVIDATNVSRGARTTLLGLARVTRRPAVAVVLDPPLAACLARNAARADRTVAQEVVRRQHAELQGSLAVEDGFGAEGFTGVHRLADPGGPVELSIVPGARRGTPGPPAGTIPTASERRRADRRIPR
ncbi:MAG: AAA family ATPase, partial [Chloroflexota bacterium]|nr:AAA family ATPase [Chloroflexota bacterium]